MVKLDDPFLIVTQWGKGLIHVQESVSERSKAFGRVNTLSKNHSSKHRRGNVPAFYIFERIGKQGVKPRANKPKAIPKKSIPVGVITDAAGPATNQE